MLPNDGNKHICGRTIRQGLFHRCLSATIQKGSNVRIDRRQSGNSRSGHATRGGHEVFGNRDLHVREPRVFEDGQPSCDRIFESSLPGHPVADGQFPANPIAGCDRDHTGQGEQDLPLLRVDGGGDGLQDSVEKFASKGRIVLPRQSSRGGLRGLDDEFTVIETLSEFEQRERLHHRVG